jgi:Fur family ferric uptake transcriptional regulator
MIDKERLTTRQRTLLGVFEHADGPLTARDAWERAGTDAMGFATVYRGLKKLVEAGLLRSVVIANETPMFEAVRRRGHHHHFYCSRCGSVFEIPRCVKGLETIVPAGFTMEDHVITLYGVCAECHAAASRPSRR